MKLNNIMNFIAESKLKELLGDKLDFLFILNMDGNILNVNSIVHSILEYTDEDLKDKHLLNVYTPRYKEKVGAIIPLAIKGDVPSCPYPLVTKSGDLIPVDTHFYIGWWQGQNVFVAVSTNLGTEFFSKEVFYSIFNGSDVMMSISTIDSNVFFNVNKSFVDTTGYTLEDISGTTIQELGIYKDYSQREILLNGVAIKGRAEGEVKIMTKRGDLLACLISMERIKIKNQYYLLAAVTNISQRKQMEDKLVHLNRQQKLLTDVVQLLNKPDNFDEIIDNVLDLIGIHTNVSRVYLFENSEDNKSISNTHEWCNEGIASKKSDFQNITLADDSPWRKLLLEDGRIFSDNIRDLPEDMVRVLEPMNVKSTLAYPIYIHSSLWGFMGFDECVRQKVWVEDEMNLLLTVTNNIANALERKYYLKQFQNSEMRLRLALDGAREGMWDWNIQEDEMYFTDTCYTMLGYAPDEYRRSRRWWEDLIHPDDLPIVQSVFANHADNKTDFYECVFRVKDKSGAWIWILDHGKIIERDENGKAIRAVGTHIDITNQKKNEQQLKDLLVTKDKLFSIISHDLRGPIGSFMQIIELMTSDTELEPEVQASFLDELKDMSKNTFYLLENLLNWSRAQRSDIICEPKKIIINDIINQNISLLGTTAAQKFIDIRFDETVNYEAYADYDMINLVVRNLVTNAIKFTGNGGLITISILLKDRFIEVTVSDNGVGISDDSADKLFIDNYFHSTYGTNREKGSGLGLALCKNFVERNGGTIRVESVLGEGSKFIFTVPLG